MHSPQSLLELACQQEAIYNALSAQFPAGTVHELRNEARRLMDQALQCAAWMQARGHSSLAHVGPFLSAPFSGSKMGIRAMRGVKVRIKAGATIRSMHPGKAGSIVTERSRVVTLHDVYAGHVDAGGFQRLRHQSEREKLLASVRQPEVVWAGTGGYWRHADLNDVELYAATPKNDSPS